jgi:hypothetical protein
MKKVVLFVSLLVLALAIPAMSTEVIVGSTLDQENSLTTLQVVVDRGNPVDKTVPEFTVGYAGAINVIGQNSEVKNVSLGAGIATQSGRVKFGLGLTANSITGTANRDGVFGGGYINLNYSLSKDAFVQAKYTVISNNEPTEGWQVGLGFSF